MKHSPYIRTDLAMESGAPEHLSCDAERRGYRFSSRALDDVTELSVLDITSKAGQTLFGREKGRYVTLSFPQIWLLSEQQTDTLTDHVADALYETVVQAVPDVAKILVVGLGNRELTPDAVGPLAVRHLQVTRHLMQFDQLTATSLSDYEISAFCPGVMGQTGIETLEIVRGVQRHVCAQAVIVIDALAARDTSRLARTVQISDTGLMPGSGVGNARKGLNRKTLGVPVIAIGVPTVVNSATLVCDALQEAGMEEFPPRLEEILRTGADFFVTPKEADAATHCLSQIIGDAMNRAFCRTQF